MASRTERGFDDNKQSEDDEYQGSEEYRGVNIGLFKQLDGKYYAVNDYGEPYNHIEIFDKPGDAIIWDQNNVDNLLEQ